MSLPLSMEKTADDACPLYHYLVVESRGPVRFPEGVELDITRLTSVAYWSSQAVLPETEG